MNIIRIVCRHSKLSLLQADIVEKKIRAAVPGINVQIEGISSRGDRENNVPLQTLEGKDFFTEDITHRLRSGQADIAVHSLKDLSSEHFFSHTAFAIPDRNVVHDIALFVPDIEEKIKEGKIIQIGTSSPRREKMALTFLQKALPQLTDTIRIETKIIRGNVDTRLKKLDSGEYDGIILAAAGLNRLLESESNSKYTADLLKGKKKMILPLMECVPAPCQGAIVVEADPANADVVEILKLINDPVLHRQCIEEKKTGLQYGSGCFQQFGVTTISCRDSELCYASGFDSNNNFFESWSPQPDFNVEGKKLFSSTDFMAKFFSYGDIDLPERIEEPVIFIANHKAIRDKTVSPLLKDKTIWVSGSRTWYELAKKGYWIEGGADALGLEWLQPIFETTLVNIQQKDICILTHRDAIETWVHEGWKVIPAYELLPVRDPAIEGAIRNADCIFWTSYQQYQQYLSFLKKDVVHMCPSGKTASLMIEAGLFPQVFANIRSFIAWRKKNFPVS